MIPRRVAGIDEGGLARLRRLLYPVEDSERQTVEFSEYDANGNVKKIDFWDSETTGGSHLEWTQVYDDFNRLTERHATFNVPAGMFFGTTDQYFVYDDLGRMVEARDWSNDFPPGEEEVKTTFAYDTASRKLVEHQLLPLNGGFKSHFHDMAAKHFPKLLNSPWNKDFFNPWKFWYYNTFKGGEP